jgi:hypothetical protein
MTELMLLSKLVIANTGKNVIAFSHKPVPGDDPAVVQNRRLIIAAINAGFTINLSADNTAHADKLAELGIAPVVTVLAAPMRAARPAAGSSGGLISGPKRSANGVIARFRCHGVRPPDGE